LQKKGRGVSLPKHAALELVAFGRVRRSLCETLLTHGAAFTSWRCPEAAALTLGGRARAAQKFSTPATMAALVRERRSGVSG